MKHTFVLQQPSRRYADTPGNDVGMFSSEGNERVAETFPRRGGLVSAVLTN